MATQVADGRAHLEEARRHAALQGCTMLEALRATAPRRSGDEGEREPRRRPASVEPHEQEAHLRRAREYREKHGCSLREALSKTATPRRWIEAGPPPPAPAAPSRSAEHLARARAYAKDHGTGIRDALSATAERRAERREPRTPVKRHSAESVAAEAHLAVARDYQAAHGGSIRDALRAVNQRAEDRAERVVGELLAKRNARAPAPPETKKSMAAYLDRHNLPKRSPSPEEARREAEARRRAAQAAWKSERDKRLAEGLGVETLEAGFPEMCRRVAAQVSLSLPGEISPGKVESALRGAGSLAKLRLGWVGGEPLEFKDKVHDLPDGERQACLGLGAAVDAVEREILEGVQS